MSNRENSNDDHFEQYTEFLDTLVGTPGRFLRFPEVAPPFWLVAYDAVPESGCTTAFTFGISSVHHPSWVLGRPELLISVNSTDDDWLLSLGAIACCVRGVCPFSFGNVLRCGVPLSRESAMSAYFIFWPLILERDQECIRLPDRMIILKQAYPIFDSEADAIARVGGVAFFMMEGLDLLDVSRSKVF